MPSPRKANFLYLTNKSITTTSRQNAVPGAWKKKGDTYDETRIIALLAWNVVTRCPGRARCGATGNALREGRDGRGQPESDQRERQSLDRPVWNRHQDAQQERPVHGSLAAMRTVQGCCHGDPDRRRWRAGARAGQWRGSAGAAHRLLPQDAGAGTVCRAAVLHQLEWRDVLLELLDERGGADLGAAVGGGELVRLRAGGPYPWRLQHQGAGADRQGDLTGVRNDPGRSGQGASDGRRRPHDQPQSITTG